MQETLSSWGPEVAACQLIFYRAVGPFNRSVLFGGKSSPLNKGDARLRPVPFPTRRATFSEVQRVHSLLATVTVYGELTVNTAPRLHRAKVTLVCAVCPSPFAALFLVVCIEFQVLILNCPYILSKVSG